MQVLTQLENAEPDFLSPHRYLRFSYFNTGNYMGFIAELKKESLLLRDPATMAEADAASKGYAQGGERGLLEALLAEQMKLSKEGKLSPFVIATEAELGDVGRFTAVLDEVRLVARRDMVSISQGQSLTRLHGNPVSRNHRNCRVPPTS